MRPSFAETIRSEIDGLTLDSELRARFNEWLKSDSDFNVWFLDTTKRTLADEELLELLEGLPHDAHRGHHAVHPSDEASPGKVLTDQPAMPRRASSACTSGSRPKNER